MRDLPHGWRAVPLRDLGTWYGGGTPSKARTDFWKDGTVPWLSPKDMGSAVLSGTQDRITEAAVTGSHVRLVPAGAVALVVRSGILERTVPVSLVPFETTLNQDMKAIAPSALVDARWIAWGLRAMEAQLLRSCRKAGTTVASLEVRRLMDQVLPVPPLDEQRRIVGILEDHLSRLDAAVQGVDLAGARLRSLREQILAHELFALGSPDGSASAPTLAPAGVDDGDLPSLPATWTWQRLGELAEVVGGVTKDAKRQADPSFVKVPYLRVANVQRGRLDLSRVTTICVPVSKADQLRLQPGDVLLNEGGDRDKLGRGWVWEGQIHNCIHQNHVFRARVRDHRIDPRLLSWAANSLGGQWCERNGKQSVNLASISLTKIRLMPVPVPPAALQPEISARIEAALEGCRRLDTEIERVRTAAIGLRRSLLEAAFSGRLTGSSANTCCMEELTGV